MEIQVWIASHLHIPIRFKWLEQCIECLGMSTMQPNLVAISYSEFEQTYDVENLFKRYLKCPYKIFKSEKRKTQFRHLENLLDKIQPNADKTLISFCDDDDIYHPERIATVFNYFQEHPDEDEVLCNAGYIDQDFVVGQFEAIQSYKEDFGSMTVRAKCLYEFCKNPTEKIIQAKVAMPVGCYDMIFFATYHKNNLPTKKYLYFFRGTPFIEDAHCWNIPYKYGSLDE